VSEKANLESGAARPRLRGTAVALGGTAAAVLYGRFGAGLEFGAALVVLALGGLALALCGLALYRVLDPLFREDAGLVEGPRAPVRRRELEREKQLVLKAIREVEHDYQMRKVSEADYKEMTQRYRARAMRLLQEIDAGDDFRVLIEQELKSRLAALEAAAAIAARTCAACGSENDPDAVFCKKCGQEIQGKAASTEPASEA
jgi:hypothetical protein